MQCGRGGSRSRQRTWPTRRKRSATHRPIKAWTVDTLRTFLELTRGDELSALWILLATTGLRRGEALGLRWSDVDLDHGRAQITQTVTAIGWQIHFGQPKTQAGKRPIALDPLTVEVLRKHRDESARSSVGGLGLVFSGDDGGPLHPERMYQAFKRAVIKHRLPRIPLHGLRHTWAPIALQSGVHPRVVQERLGHSNIAITLQTTLTSCRQCTTPPPPPSQRSSCQPDRHAHSPEHRVGMVIDRLQNVRVGDGHPHG